MRTRSRSLPAYAIKRGYVKSNGFSYFETAQFTPASTASITDDASKGRQQKYVSHTKRWYNVGSVDLINSNIVTSYPDNGVRITSTNFARHFAAQNAWQGGGWNSIRPTLPGSVELLSGLDARLYKMFTSCMPSLNRGLSLVNFILELKDLRRMFSFETLESAFKMMKRVGDLKRFRSTLRSLSKARTLDLAKPIASDYLNYMFGWKPFIGDLISMFRALTNTEETLRYIEKNANRLVTRHSSDFMLDEFPLKPTVVTNYGDVSWLDGNIMKAPRSDISVKYTSRYLHPPRCNMTVIYSYTLPKVSELRRKIRSYLDAFGVMLDPSIVWNAIPFSFVVDWVVDVGGWLRQFRPNDLDMVITVHDASYSLKYHYLNECTLRWPVQNSPALVMRDDLIAQEEGTLYNRRPWIPKGLGVNLTPPNGQQWLLGGALVTARKR